MASCSLHNLGQALVILGVRRVGAWGRGGGGEVNVAHIVPCQCTKGFLTRVLLIEYTHGIDILPLRFSKINRIV